MRTQDAFCSLQRAQRVVYPRCMSETTIERIEDRSGHDPQRTALRTVRHTSRTKRSSSARSRLAVVPRDPTPAPAQPQVTGSIIDQYPAAAAITATHESVVVGELADALWRDYIANFAPLADLAILRHVDTREAFLAQLANPKIVKIICWVEDQ